MRTPVTALIHIDALKNNLRVIRRLAGGRKLLLPVKADAYGHGALSIVKAVLEEERGASFGVARYSEALKLREAGIEAPIVLFSQCTMEEMPSAVGVDLSFFTSNIETARFLSECGKAQGKRVGVHLKIDTGMGRLGASLQDAPALAKFIAESANLRLDGVCTHLASSDSLSKDDEDFTRLQIKRFADCADAIKKSGVDTGILHAAASAGLLKYPESLFDMVRPGLLLYGYAPGELAAPPDIKPVLELEARVSFVKRITAGTPVSYGRTWTADKDVFLATLPIGYGDGLPRAASGKLRFVINGAPCLQVGRICMDQCMALVTSECRAGDRAIIFGGRDEGGDGCTAQDIADAASTIPYEILTGITARVPRLEI